MKILNLSKIKTALIVTFVCLLFASGNFAMSEKASSATAPAPVSTKQGSDVLQRSLWAILAFGCLGAGVYFLYISWKNSESLIDDFDISFNDIRDSNLSTPGSINEAIRLFLRKMK